jgi:pimeloyl-ACP methyl ester carboxylesterase
VPIRSTFFASSTDGALVYIDSAYNRTKVQQLPQPEATPDTDHDFASVENWNADIARETNSRGPNTEVCNTRFVSSDGQVGKRKTSDEIPAQFLKLLEPPEYAKIQAPALALYARPDAHRIFPAYDEYSDESKARVDRLIEVTRPYQEDAIKQFKAEVAHAQVEVLDGGHYLFLTNEADVVWLTRRFLKQVAP